MIKKVDRKSRIQTPHIHAVNPLEKMTVVQNAGPFDKGHLYSDYGLEIHTDHDPHNSKKIKNKTLALFYKTHRHRDQWLGVFSELVGMEPGEREKFNWKAAVTE